jgi:hypothetical protein
LNLDDAARIIGRLKAAFPVMTLDEDQAEVLLKEVALLHDPAILDEAVGYLIHREERFPPIARIRLAYRSVADAHHAAAQALERAAPAPADRGIPEWVHVWWWRSQQTMTARQAANTTCLGPVEQRPPVGMRPFPQFAHLAPHENAYTQEEYERIRDAWVKAGSPELGSATELAAGVVHSAAVGAEV